MSAQAHRYPSSALMQVLRWWSWSVIFLARFLSGWGRSSDHASLQVLPLVSCSAVDHSS